jgi:hypothetical protein
MSDLIHFYHCWVDGDWEEPLLEHQNALDDAGIPFAARYAVLVGCGGCRVIPEAHYFSPASGWTVAHRQETGHEDVTINLVRQYAIEHPDTRIFYAHDKASWHRGPNDIHVAWRRRIQEYTVDRWQECVRALDDHDTAGPHWLTYERYASVLPFSPEATTPFYAGNYWWANAAYLATLPECPPIHGDTERWIGWGNPRAYSQDDRWPDASPCLPPPW